MSEQPAQPNQYPECEKLKAVSEYSQQIGAFLDEGGRTICEWNDETCQWMPLRMTMEEVLAAIFEIDLVKVEEERRLMISSLQSGEYGS